MYPATFEYHRPTTVEEAVKLLASHKDDAKLLAGGHSLLPLMKLRLATPKHVVDVCRIGGLTGIRAEGDRLVIGALTTHYAVESDASLKTACPILSEAAAMIGDPQVRNVGTIGGSLVHADPAADWPAVILVLGAELTVVGPERSRTIPADDFFKDLLTTALAPDEMLTEIRVPVPPSGAGSAYVKCPHPASRFAVVGIAAVLSMSRGTCHRARVAVTGVGPKATRATGVEAALGGRSLDPQTIAAAAEKAAEGIAITEDLQGSVEYKQHLTRVYTKRALEAALGRARIE